MESASSQGAARQHILNARASDTKTFYKLIDKQRGRLSLCVNELQVGESTYSTAFGVLQGWGKHFRNLATPDPTIKCDHVTMSTRTEKPEKKIHISRPMGKPTICICENKGADQLRRNCEADQRLCFRNTDSRVPLQLKCKISSF